MHTKTYIFILMQGCVSTINLMVLLPGGKLILQCSCSKKSFQKSSRGIWTNSRRSQQVFHSQDWSELCVQKGAYELHIYFALKWLSFGTLQKQLKCIVYQR